MKRVHPSLCNQADIKIKRTVSDLKSQCSTDLKHTGDIVLLSLYVSSVCAADDYQLYSFCIMIARTRPKLRSRWKFKWLQAGGGTIPIVLHYNTVSPPTWSDRNFYRDRNSGRVRVPVRTVILLIRATFRIPSEQCRSQFLFRNLFITNTSSENYISVSFRASFSLFSIRSYLTFHFVEKH